jgi:hypothetical protein
LALLQKPCLLPVGLSKIFCLTASVSGIRTVIGYWCVQPHCSSLQALTGMPFQKNLTKKLSKKYPKIGILLRNFKGHS